MSLTVEEIQKTLAESMMSMQSQMSTERENFKKKIATLEETLAKKEEEIANLKDSLTSNKKENDMTNIIIANLNKEIREKEKIISTKDDEHKQDIMEINNLKNQLQIKEQNIMQLNLDKKNINADWEKKNQLPYWTYSCQGKVMPPIFNLANNKKNTKINFKFKF